jgi:hypothetical protein
LSPIEVLAEMAYGSGMKNQGYRDPSDLEVIERPGAFVGDSCAALRVAQEPPDLAPSANRRKPRGTCVGNPPGNRVC